MASKKESGLLSSAQQRRGELASAGLSLSTAVANGRDADHILQESGKQALRMRMYAEKTAYALTQAGKLQTHTAREFDGTCKEIDQVAASAAGTASEGHVKVFADLQKDQLADQMMDIYDTGVNMIKAEIRKPLPNGAPEPERKGIVARLLG